jgi:hypothetical protein
VKDSLFRKRQILSFPWIRMLGFHFIPGGQGEMVVVGSAVSSGVLVPRVP